MPRKKQRKAAQQSREEKRKYKDELRPVKEKAQAKVKKLVQAQRNAKNKLRVLEDGETFPPYK